MRLLAQIALVIAAGVAAVTSYGSFHGGVPSEWRPDAAGRRERDPLSELGTGTAIFQIGRAGSLQRALDEAAPGDVIELDPGAVYIGPFKLPRKRGDGTIIIRSSSGRLPPAGTRVSPRDAEHMPKLEASEESVIRAAHGAKGYRFIGIEIRPARGTSLVNLVDLGSDAKTLEAMPSHIVFERCYLHGDPKRGGRRAIAMNSRHTKVIDSYLADFKVQGADSQAIAGWLGPGPYTIVNNYLEAAGENVMFGGGDPTISGLVPSDIEIASNHMRKPYTWKKGHPSYAGTEWTVKNLLELKNARRVVIRDNLFEQNWGHAQSGYAILFTVRNQDGNAPWSVVEDVTFERNVIRHTDAGVNILGRDHTHRSGSQRTARIMIRDNLFHDVAGPLFQLLEGTSGVAIEHNTALQSGQIIVAEGEPHERFVFRANIAPHNEYGIVGTGTAPGRHTLETFFPDAVVAGNVMPGAAGLEYPAGNAYPRSLDEVFADARAGGYELAASSGLRKAAGSGRPPGADLDALQGALAAGDGVQGP